jgi:putative DNA primase/helicase
LEPALRKELPGILNWALGGLHSLSAKNDNQFTHLPSVDEAITTMRDLASPVAAFVRERCRTGAREVEGVDEIYVAYKEWAEDNNHPKLAKTTFGRDLRAAVASLKVSRPRSETSARSRVYEGISLIKTESTLKS